MPRWAAARPPPSPPAAPAPLPGRLQRQRRQLRAFSPQPNCRAPAWRGVAERCPEQVGEGADPRRGGRGLPCGSAPGCPHRGDEGAEPAAAARRGAAGQVSAAPDRGSRGLRGASPNWHRNCAVWDFLLKVGAWKYSLSALRRATWIAPPLPNLSTVSQPCLPGGR